MGEFDDAGEGGISGAMFLDRQEGMDCGDQCGDWL